MGKEKKIKEYVLDGLKTAQLNNCGHSVSTPTVRNNIPLGHRTPCLATVRKYLTILSEEGKVRQAIKDDSYSWYCSEND